MNTFGIWTGFITLFIIGLGFPLVIHGERRFGLPLWPYMMAAGMAIIAASLFITADLASVITGAFGASFVWGSTEIKEQAVRAEIGWFPFNPDKIRLPFAGIIGKWKAPHL